MSAKTKVLPFPGAKQYSDQIFLLESPESTPSKTDDDPRIIIIFGWGDGQAKHVSKYIVGYKALFPSVTRIVVVLATTMKAAYQPLDERVAGMMPVLDAAFPDGPVPVPDNMTTQEAGRHSRVLLHTMSNAGGINLASALHAYKQRFGTALPHRLLVLDSTPGGVIFHEQVGRWARAMAIGMSRNLPWPYLVTYGLCYTFLWMMKGWDWVLGRHHAGAYSRQAVNEDGDIIAVPARRLYLYSKEDDIILWNDIEAHAAEAKSLGFGVELHMFEGSDHVGHLRRHPEEYWRVVGESWKGVD